MAVSKDGQQYRFVIPGISAADLQFLHWMPRVRNRNLKSKAAVEQDCFELNRPVHGPVHLSSCGRGIGRHRRPFLKRTPKRSFGYVASTDAIRVRGFALTIDRDPHPNSLRASFARLDPQGEREAS